MKNEKRKENKVKTGIVLTLLFIGCYLLFGCNNDFETPQDAAKAGYGKVAVTINGAAARTVFPTMTFAKYEYLFAKVTNGTPGTPQAQVPVDGFFSLELGDWQLTVKAYATATDTAPAATGTSATFTVTGSGAAQATVHLSGNAATGSGNFVYTITYPAGATISGFSLKNLQNETVTNISVSGASPRSGSTSVSAGYYFLTIQLTEGGGTGRTTGANEVVYIYDKLDSEYSKIFSTDDFSHIHQWNNNWVTTAPTCTTAGWDTRTCALNAEHTDTRPGAAAIGHDWNTAYITIAAATETTDGIEAITCKHDSSHTNGIRTVYATGTAGLDFTLISINGGTNNAYRVSNKDTSNGTAAGAIVIPAYHRPDAGSPYLPVTRISNGTDGQSSNAFGRTSSSSPNTTVTSVTFAANSQLTSISAYAFYYCSNLASITIPEGVTSIGIYAFGGCTSLTSITIPASVTTIGGDAFGYSRLASVTFTAGSQLQTIGQQAFEGCTSLTSITIPASVTSIGIYAFNSCTNLASITIPASVTEIGDNAFRYCTSLTSITIPEDVTEIGDYTFENCTNLASITLPASLTSIGEAAFINCESLTNITLPASLTSIGEAAFVNCESLTNITIPEGVTSIGGNAFGGCTSLTSITIPEGVTSIGSSTFSSCISLTNITIPEGVTSIGSGAFRYCTSLTSITIPNSVTSIGDYAFAGSYIDNALLMSLQTVTFAAGSQLQTIGNSTFSLCTSLTSITIPADVTSIGQEAFLRCTGLTIITIPAGVTTIGGDAFRLWTSSQTINVRGYSSQSAADSAWGSSWRSDCNAIRKYWNGSSYQ